MGQATSGRVELGHSNAERRLLEGGASAGSMRARERKCEMIALVRPFALPKVRTLKKLHILRSAYFWWQQRFRCIGHSLHRSLHESRSSGDPVFITCGGKWLG